MKIEILKEILKTIVKRTLDNQESQNTIQIYRYGDMTTYGQQQFSIEDNDFSYDDSNLQKQVEELTCRILTHENAQDIAMIRDINSRKEHMDDHNEFWKAVIFDINLAIQEALDNNTKKVEFRHNFTDGSINFDIKIYPWSTRNQLANKAFLKMKKLMKQDIQRNNK